jgi:hypothetical protein
MDPATAMIPPSGAPSEASVADYGRPRGSEATDRAPPKLEPAPWRAAAGGRTPRHREPRRNGRPGARRPESPESHTPASDRVDPRGKRSELVRDLFRTLDRDEDGRLSGEELHLLALANGYKGNMKWTKRSLAAYANRGEPYLTLAMFDWSVTEPDPRVGVVGHLPDQAVRRLTQTVAGMPAMFRCTRPEHAHAGHRTISNMESDGNQGWWCNAYSPCHAYRPPWSGERQPAPRTMTGGESSSRPPQHGAARRRKNTVSPPRGADVRVSSRSRSCTRPRRSRDRHWEDGAP